MIRTFFAPNIGKRGRLVRGFVGLVLLVIAGRCHTVWLSGLLTGVGVFMVFEALRGWCILRACHLKVPF